MNAQQLADHCGITYRQVDYWTSCGYLVPDNSTPHLNGKRKIRKGHTIANPGSGFSRHYSDDEVRIAKLAASMVRFGFTPSAAFQAARDGICVLCGGQLLTAGSAHYVEMGRRQLARFVAVLRIPTGGDT